VTRQSVANNISGTIMNVVTPKTGAKHELSFNKPASGTEVYRPLDICGLGKSLTKVNSSFTLD
jgi:hypothetical protein